MIFKKCIITLKTDKQCLFWIKFSLVSHLKIWLQLAGLGNVLTLDEFFLYPLHQHDETYQTETLTYFLEENVNNHEIMDARGNELSRHGIQVRFQTDIADTDNMNKAVIKGFSKDLNVVEMSDANKLFLESGKGKGGAEVRVIAGQFEHISSSISFEESVRLLFYWNPLKQKCYCNN